MRIALAIALALSACGGNKADAPPPRPEVIETMRVLADSACACETDKDCLKTVRADWDAQKDDLLRHGLTGEQKAAFDAELHRIRHCGDAGGLTFWMPPPTQ